MRKSILVLIACVILPVSCLQKDVDGNKLEGNERVVNHRNDPIVANDIAPDSSDNGNPVIGGCDPQTVWYLQDLHVTMDNAAEAAAVKDSVYKDIKEEKESWINIR